jgi:NAD-dependent deacetylase
MHGELKAICCTACDHSDRTEEDITVDTACPSCGAPMRPDVVWFGEYPKFLNELERVLDNTDVFVSIGTSGQVMPASLFAGAVRMAKPEANIIEVNPAPTGDPAFNTVIVGTAVEALPQLVDDLIAKYANQEPS